MCALLRRWLTQSMGALPSDSQGLLAMGYCSNKVHGLLGLDKQPVLQRVSDPTPLL